MDKKVVETIKKLLALAGSCNEHEAKLAMVKANEFLTRHNLSLQDVESAEFNYGKSILTESRKAAAESKFVLAILNEFFFITTVKSRNRKQGFTTIYLLGEEVNVKVAEFTYSFLLSKFKDLWKTYQKENDLPAKFKSSYYNGLYVGIKDQLRERRFGVEKETGLVVVDDPKLDKFTKDCFSKLSTTTSSVTIRDSESVDAGIAAGKGLKLTQGIAGNNSKGLTA